MTIKKTFGHIPKLQASQIHIWKGDVDISSISDQELKNILTIDEIKRSEKFKFERDRNRFLHRRHYLRSLLGLYLDCSPADLVFVTGSNGKPYLRDFPEFKFNLSHARGKILIGCTLDREIGVDLEFIDDRVDCKQIAFRFFSSKENSQLNAYESADQVKAFFYGWTRKEAFLKADGRGLQIPLDSFDVALECKELPELSIQDLAFTHLKGNLYNIPLDANHLGAAFVIGGQRQNLSIFDL